MADEEDEAQIKAQQRELAKVLRQELTEQWRKPGSGLRKRENTIMTRIAHEDLQFLEALVELEIFRSISETAAFLIHDAIQNKKKHMEQILRIADEIKKKKLEAVRTLLEGVKETEGEEGDAGHLSGEEEISLPDAGDSDEENPEDAD
jgi:glutamine synthetase adenylyltransferase